MDNMDFANRIYELRRNKGLSQKELGDMLGVSNKAVSKWENGESMPKTSTMLKLAEILEIDGNELIGLDIKDKPADSSNFDDLKNENDALRSELLEMKNKRKRVLVTILCVSVVFIIGACVIAFSVQGNSNRYNKSVSDAGQSDTKIVFDDVTFVPSNNFTKFVIDEESYLYSGSFDTKYADYYNASGDKQTVAISCSKEQSYIKLKSAGKQYYYVKENMSSDDLINESVVFDIEMYYGSIADNEKMLNFREYIYGSPDESYSVYDDGGEEFIKQFCDFYNNKPSPADSKITELYLGHNSKIVLPAFSSDETDYSSFVIGEFFKDDDSNVYFYDYVTTSSYPVEKEVANYVYK
jgi:transcriptional regulator with XRE-family HTH domain